MRRILRQAPCHRSRVRVASGAGLTISWVPRSRRRHESGYALDGNAIVAPRGILAAIGTPPAGRSLELSLDINLETKVNLGPRNPSSWAAILRGDVQRQ